MKRIPDHKATDYNIGDLVEHTFDKEKGIVIAIEERISVQWKGRVGLHIPQYLRILSKGAK